MNNKRLMLWIYLLGSVAITVAVNFDHLIVQYIYSWARITVPICLFVGSLSSIIRSSGVAALLFKTIGWIGLTVFFLIAIRVVFPDEMVRSDGDPPPANIFVAVPRMILLLGLLAITIYAFKRLHRAPRVNSSLR